MSSSAREPAARWATGGPLPRMATGPANPPLGVRRWWGGHAAYYGRVGPRVVRKIGRPTIARKGHRRADVAASDPSTFLPSQRLAW